MKAKSVNEIIKALRCSATDCKCKDGCPYRVEEDVTDDPDFKLLKPDMEKDGRKYYVSCDCDQMVLDAAEYLEYATSRQSDMLAKFICQIGEMAEKNWCSSQVEMLERLIGATLHGVAYDEWEKEEEGESNDSEGTD